MLVHIERCICTHQFYRTWNCSSWCTRNKKKKKSETKWWKSTLWEESKYGERKKRIGKQKANSVAPRGKWGKRSLSSIIIFYIENSFCRIHVVITTDWLIGWTFFSTFNFFFCFFFRYCCCLSLSPYFITWSSFVFHLLYSFFLSPARKAVAWRRKIDDLFAMLIAIQVNSKQKNRKHGAQSI